MATAHYAVPAAPVVVVTPAVTTIQPDIELAHRAADLLVVLTPARDIEKTVVDLIDQMSAEKFSREKIGLNHWSEHAPMFLARIVREERLARLRRRQALETFRRSHHSEVLAYAYAAFKDRDEAEDVVSQTYIEFLEGRTDEKKFLRALKMNILDRQRRQAWQRERFQAAEESFESRESSGADTEGDGAAWEPRSYRRDDQDPLDILIALEDDRERRREVSKAMVIARGCRKYRWVREKDWAKSLPWKAAA